MTYEKPNMKNESNLKTNEAGALLFVPEICMTWKSLTIDNFGVKIPINTEPGMSQYWLPVFESEDDCKKHYPNCKIQILKK